MSSETLTMARRILFCKINPYPSAFMSAACIQVYFKLIFFMEANTLISVHSVYTIGYQRT